MSQGSPGVPGSDRDGQLDDRELGHTAIPGAGAPPQSPRPPRPRHGGRRRGRSDPNAVVPEAEFTSYYGRPVVKPSPWTRDIPLYLFSGGLAGSSALLGEGGAWTGRPVMRRAGRLGAIAGLVGSFYFLVNDLGRPSRFYNMLRIAKPTSPMSMGTWFLTAFGLPSGITAASEVVRLLPDRVTDPIPPMLLQALHACAKPAGLVAATAGALVSTYTAVLLSDTATPAWSGARRELPVVFAGSAASSAAGLALLAVPASEVRPARLLAVAGALVELGAQVPMRRSMGIAAQTLDEGTAGRWHRASQILMPTGAVLAAVSRRSRVVSGLAGLALLGGSLCTRFAIFEAGQASAKDPRYTVVPQRERAQARASANGAASA